MTFFAPAEIAELEALLAEARSETAQVARMTRVSNKAGGYTDTPQVVATEQIFRAPEVAGAGEVVVGGQGVQGLRWKMLFRSGADIRETDRIQIGSVVYEVVAVAGPQTVQAGLLVYALRR